ncbi:diguanylate cyclase (GGDEF) domain-containing protein [Pseudoxanthomonas sp. CF385]|uniref:putative bifunctional diguanylate cyclase/phosphodiesterase n=1 Tax=Pseudoxanthomonas sp. CF385 TaxID=1881042 RepID=UPI00088D8C1A|nr:GGDEF domain-containing phosphodiesterase [Pseudoxanthomonas sp. CF385]SDQ92502.1 diguanylate cyclase (GGDEF) domain-containing protein [Pseudoxanthomonas sp. CF385]
MKALRFGLQARFLAAMAVMLLVVIALVATLLHRQKVMQKEVADLGRDAMHGMVEDSLRRHGEATVDQLADALANPLYYFDLDGVGALVRSAQKEPDVSYVLVYDNQGRIIHDGTADIAVYGQTMTDPLAYEAINARAMHTQWSTQIVDVSEPIMIGSERIGGVRVGYSVASVRAYEEKAIAAARARLNELGARHLGWIALLLAALAGVSVAIMLYVQRTLVRPIRQLARAAHDIEVGNYNGERMASARQDEVGELVRAFGTMSDSIARHDRDVRRMAYTDSLTGLTNRLAFRESLDHRLMMLRGAGRQLALLFADIDDFKRVNDTLGHEAGDEVLQQFAHRIRDAVELLGGDDALLARFGGDEFVILIQDGDVRGSATRLAEKLVAELGRPIVVQERQVFLGTSIGITLFPEDASGATALMKNGDIAMYQAKVAGKNCYRFYSRAMDQAVERRVRMEQELRGAWERGELSLMYQPVFRLSDSRIIGAEALLRWQHPELGMVAPSVFIDVAEQSGLIESIGPRVLRAACAAAARWGTDRDALDPLFVSVNVSPRQLRSGDLPDVVADCLRDTGLPPSRLHLELTETAVIADEAHASALLATLHRTGVKVWLDDFGTGFSGLSHLRRVPVDGVKIDRSFIADMLRDPDDLALTTAIIAMAHSLGITVVAEGVEKEGQFNLLRERGCDLAQGYWLGYPVTAAEFTQLIA